MGLVSPAFEAPIEAHKVVSLGDSGEGFFFNRLAGHPLVVVCWVTGNWKALSKCDRITEMVDFYMVT